jgi:hypothetical protein
MGTLTIQDARFQLLSRRVTAASRSVSVFLPEVYSAPASQAQVEGVVVVALTASLPAAEQYAEVVLARLEVELAAVELVHSGWALSDCSAELLAYDLAPAEL